MNSSSSEEPHVILFLRHLTRKIAGGSRSVLDRAAMFVEAGYRVTLVVLEFNPRPGEAIDELRRDRILHPGVDILGYWSLFDTPERMIAASYHVRKWPFVDPATYDTCTREMNGDNLARRDYYLKDVLTRTERWSKGRPSLCEMFDLSGNLTERWRFDRNGKLFSIDEFGGEANVALSRTLFVNGAIKLARIDLRLPLGRGAVDGEGIAAGSTWASVVAGEMDRIFADVRKLIVIADGENVSQTILREMRHPGIVGISVLHNNHLDSPYASDAPTKPLWVPFLEDVRNIDYMVCLTERQKHDLLTRYPDQPAVVIHHAVLPPPPIKIKRHPFRVVFVGRLSHQKQLDHLLAVFQRVHRTLPQSQLWVYGDGTERDSFKEKIRTLNLVDAVTMNGFTIDPLSAFASGALTLMTSHYEGLPLTLGEAMSVGTPFVAYDLNYGPAEMIENGKNGILITAGDIDAMAQAVVALLTDSRRLAEMSAAARTVVDTFNRDRNRENWLKLIAGAHNPQLSGAKASLGLT